MSATLRGLLLCAVMALLLVPGAPVRAQDNDVDVGYFYEELEAYGRWTNHPRWGDVWSPDTGSDWRPYTQGYWAYTEENGWYWVSDEPFGWAVFHYGRWVLDPDDGWLWIPGTEWGPAWVAWRADDDDDGFIGWAPLPPEARWGSDGSLFYDERYYDDPRFASVWVFVRPTYLTVPGMYRYAAPRAQNLVLLRRARFLHSYRRFDRRVFNTGIDLPRFERWAKKPVPRVRLNISTDPRNRDFRDRPGGNELRVFRPNFVAPRDGKRPHPNYRPEGAIGKRPDYKPEFRDERGKGPGGPGGPGNIGKGPEYKPEIRNERGKAPSGPGNIGKGPEYKPEIKKGPDGPGNAGKAPAYKPEPRDSRVNPGGSKGLQQQQSGGGNEQRGRGQGAGPGGGGGGNPQGYKPPSGGGGDRGGGNKTESRGKGQNEGRDR